ncbi:MAG TPA: hypothetical protein VGJ95_06120 [Pseudonocardiaceae bacterium]
MTPNLGQRACQALEDAATLGAVLDEQLRPPGPQDIVRRSRRMGAIGQWSWPPAVALRDRVLPLVPPSVATRARAGPRLATARLHHRVRYRSHPREGGAWTSATCISRCLTDSRISSRPRSMA